jgi:branched-chain amino acid aminotransferase
MLLPIDDRTATRAHGVFDVLYVKNKRIINMEQHIARLFKSAASVNIVPPFDRERTQSLLLEVIDQTISHHLHQDKAGILKKKFL